MGTTIYYGYYPPEVENDKILPYIKEDLGWGQELNGKHVPDKFYENLYECSTHYEEGDCYIIHDYSKIMEFAALPSTPNNVADYISECIPEDIEHPIFIMWMR